MGFARQRGVGRPPSAPGMNVARLVVAGFAALPRLTLSALRLRRSAQDGQDSRPARHARSHPARARGARASGRRPAEQRPRSRRRGGEPRTSAPTPRRDWCSALDDQLATISGEADVATSERGERREGARRQANIALHARLVDIYKRGPLFTTQVMLSARSFGELVARYKYLHMLALHDRALVTRVEELRDRVTHEQTRLVGLRGALEVNRSDKAREEAQLRALERRARRHARADASARREPPKTGSCASRRPRRSSPTSSPASTPTAAARKRRVRTRRRSTSTIHTSDYGRLDWPVDGPLVYTFGKAQTASNTTIRWNGVGIRAPVGTTRRRRGAGARRERRAARHVRPHRDHRSRWRRLLDLRLARARRRARAANRGQGPGRSAQVGSVRSRAAAASALRDSPRRSGRTPGVGRSGELAERPAIARSLRFDDGHSRFRRS